MPTVSFPTGRVSADEVLTLEAIREQLGLGQAAMREARKKGLIVRRIGRRGYVLGADLDLFHPRQLGRGEITHFFRCRAPAGCESTGGGKGENLCPVYVSRPEMSNV